MAANLIKFDKNKDMSRQVLRFAQMLRDAVEQGRHIRDAMIQGIDGDTSSADQFDLLVPLFGAEAGDYADANTAMKALYDEVAAVLGKVDTDSSVSNVKAAIAQLCAKLAA